MVLNKLISTGGGGVTSCLSMRLYHAIKWFEDNGEFPDEIDSSQQFSIYRDKPEQDVSEIILSNYHKPNEDLYTSFDPGHQFAFYDNLEIGKLSALVNAINPVSSLVGDRSHNMMQRLEGRTAVLYRGNDKALDIPRCHYQGFVNMANESESERFLVQTDENNFYDFFKERFPDTICFEEVPRIDKDPDAYVMPKVGQRVDFCINFLAALRAIAQASKLIMNTGNTGMYCMFFRGHVNNVWQMQGANQKYRKLYYDAERIL